MIRWLRNASIALLASAGLFAASPIYPAQANTIYSCDDGNSVGNWGRVCLYDGTYFGTYYWEQYDISYLWQDCDNLPGANWMSSMIINPTGPGADALNGHYVRVYPNDNCVGTPIQIYAVSDSTYEDMRETPWGNRSNTANSIKVS